MTNFTQMRNNMITGQFLPGLIKSKKILDIFESLPRENFLPEKFRMLAYSDLNIKIRNKRYIPSPFIIAKILEEIKFKGSEMILLIGSNVGYEATIISKLGDTVIAIEEDIEMKKLADKNIKDFNIENIVLINNKHHLGHKKLGPYDAIISLDPLLTLSNDLLSQLAEGGKLLYFERQDVNLNETKLSIFHNIKNKFIKQQLFDLNLPCPINTKIHNSKFNFS